MTNLYQLELLIHAVCSLSVRLFNSIDPVVVVVLMMVVEGSLGQPGGGEGSKAH